jgi:hypothetical protein
LILGFIIGYIVCTLRGKRGKRKEGERLQQRA